jgi:hypothetical protein
MMLFAYIAGDDNYRHYPRWLWNLLWYGHDEALKRG